MSACDARTDGQDLEVFRLNSDLWSQLFMYVVLINACFLLHFYLETVYWKFSFYICFDVGWTDGSYGLHFSISCVKGSYLRAIMLGSSFVQSWCSLWLYIVFFMQWWPNEQLQEKQFWIEHQSIMRIVSTLWQQLWGTAKSIISCFNKCSKAIKKTVNIKIWIRLAQMPLYNVLYTVPCAIVHLNRALKV